MKLMDRVKVVHSTCYDFVASMLKLNNSEAMKPKEKPNPDIIEWVEENKTKIPPKIQKQLDIFFNLETSYGMVPIIYARESKSKRVPEFLEYMKSVSANEMVSLFMYSGIGPGKDIDEKVIENLLADQGEALQFINEYLTISPQEKWQVLQFLMNPEQAKVDLINLLHWYYDNIYKAVEEEVAKFLLKHEEELLDKLDKYGEEYLKLITGVNHPVLSKDQEITLALSYYYERSYAANLLVNIFVLGYRYQERIEGEHSLLSGVKVFKALGDETRLNIIKLLRDRPWYGHELAVKLGLSNSTVTHHVSALISVGLIGVSREENRVYFSLDAEKLKQVVNETVDKMLEG